MIYFQSDSALIFSSLVVLQSHKKASAWRNRTFPHFEQLTLAFDKDRACDRDAQDGYDVLEEVGAENEHAGNDHDGLDDIPLTEPPTDIDPEIHSSPFTTTNQPEGSSAPRKRRRVGCDRDEVIVDSIERVCDKLCGQMGDKLGAATSALCSTVEKLAHKIAMDARTVELWIEISKVPSLTRREMHAAHIKISRDHSLLVGFPSIPDEEKAEWIREVIG